MILNQGALMPILTITMTIVGGLVIVYLGTNILIGFAVALLGIATAGIASTIAYKLFKNTRNNCDLFNFKRCSK